MSRSTTFTIIKPGAVQNRKIGAILGRIEEAGFRFCAIKTLKLDAHEAEMFYAEHEGKPFFSALVEFMSSGPIIIAILEKENAVEEFRRLIGATDPHDAEEGTIRRLYAESKSHNAIHGSDSDKSAKRECNYFFSKRERF